MSQLNSEEAEVEKFYDLQDLDITSKKKNHGRALGSKNRKSRDTWNNRQVWPRCTK